MAGRVYKVVHVQVASTGVRSGSPRHGRAAVERHQPAVHCGHARTPTRRQRSPPAAPPPRPLPQLVNLQYIQSN